MYDRKKYTPDEHQILRESRRDWTKDEKDQMAGWRSVRFLSHSKGRRKLSDGTTNRRWRKDPVEVTLNWDGKDPVREGKRGARFDERAAETLGSSVAGQDQVETLARRLERIRNR